MPKAAEYDKTMKYPWDIVKKAWEVGIMNGHIPEHVGKFTRNPSKENFYTNY